MEINKDIKEINKELIELVQKLIDIEPIDEKGNPFATLPNKDLIEIKTSIEEIAEEFAPNLKSLKD